VVWRVQLRIRRQAQEAHTDADPAPMQFWRELWVGRLAPTSFVRIALRLSLEPIHCRPLNFFRQS